MARSSAVLPLALSAIAFVVGMVAGGYGPRAELREAEDALFEAKRECARAAPASPAGEQLGRLLRGDLGAADLAAGDAGPGEATRPDDGTPPPDDGSADDDGAAPAEDGAEEAPADLAEAQAAAADVLSMRRAQARAALLEQADPNGVQLDTIDSALARMNDELFAIAEDAVFRLQEQGDLGRRDTMVLAADALDAFIAAEEEVLGTLTPEQRARLDPEVTDPTSFVDPAIVDVLAGLEGWEP